MCVICAIRVQNNPESIILCLRSTLPCDPELIIDNYFLHSQFSIKEYKINNL
jgi:hypothetical protein